MSGAEREPPSRREPILPGATLGVLGGGQLGRMFAMAARQLGYRVHVLVPEADSPTGQVADRAVTAAYSDLDAVAEFAQGVDAVTFEFENIDVAAADMAERFAPVRPAGRVLHTTQDRAREKSFLSGVGLPVTPFEQASTAAEVEAAVTRLGLPAVLKTAAWGYDGKGQAVLRSDSDISAACDELGPQPKVVERMIDFAAELSLVGVRSLDGQFRHFGPFLNDHVNGILDVSSLPAPIPPAVANEAADIAQAVLEQLDVVGVLCVEFFLTRERTLLINECAPRPHNSGHLTRDACLCDQFEQQVRAVCHLPLGDTRLHRPAAMVNLLGDLWQDGIPDWSAALASSSLAMHLYGKAEPRPGRKMGHLTALAGTPREAIRRVRQARAAIARQSSPSSAV